MRDQKDNNESITQTAKEAKGRVIAVWSLLIAAVAAITITIAVLIGITGCTTFDNFKAAFIDKPQDKGLQITIGVLEPITGSQSQAAEDEIRGIQLANKTHPNVSGKEVSLVFSDNKSDIYATETAIKTLITKEPTVILGSYGSVYSLAAAPYIEEAQIPTIAISNLNPLVTRNNEYYFRVCYVDSNQGDILARYVLEEKKGKKAGVLLPKGDDAAMAMATAFTDRIKAETQNDDAIPVYEYYETGQKDFSAELEIIRDSGVKYVILPGNYTDAANIITQAKKTGTRVQFMGDTSWGQKEFKSLLGKNIGERNMAFVQFFANEGKVEGEAETKERQVFLDAYAEEYGQDSEPTENMALGYDAYFIAIDAISKAQGKKTPKDVEKILSDPQYSFDGACGEINFNSYGDPIKPAYINTWKGKKVKTIATIKALK